MSSTSDMLRDIADFHELILGVNASPQPSLVSQEYCLERMRFMHEELTEFAEASSTGDIVGVADALADIVYVALGTAYKMGLPFDDIWRAVQYANMQKVKGMTKRGNAIDAVKPTGWVGPEAAIARAINNRMRG